MKNVRNKPQENRDDRVIFDERSVQNLTQPLNQLASISEIEWEFTDTTLTVKGLDEEPIIFSHWKSARSFLDGYLMGYDDGFGDARETAKK